MIVQRKDSLTVTYLRKFIKGSFYFTAKSQEGIFGLVTHSDIKTQN